MMTTSATTRVRRPLRAPLVALALAAGLIQGCTVFGIRSGTEEPPYETVERLRGGIEIRAYSARLYAEATAPTDASNPRNAAFRKLFRYIGGANDGGRKISMTIPVETAAGAGEDGVEIAMTAPVETAEARDGGMTMRFFLPRDFTRETAPRPSDPAVTIGEIPTQTMAVLQFSGTTRDSAVAARKRDLKRGLEATADWRLGGPIRAYFYDPPWTLPFFKRNEVAAPVERVAPETDRSGESS
ncbi:MAG: heme-binding protein [Marivibrio sp.]